MSSNCLIEKGNALVLKGLGILLMLIHHLFYNPESRLLYDDVIVSIHGHEYGLVHQFGVYGKLCVALFVFLSGYGLSVSTPKGYFSLKDFYIRRFTKLYMNYWFLVLIFVPIGIFVFGRTLSDVYGNQLFLVVLDFWGVLSLFGYNGYNPTWWFYSCIITLYLLYPFLSKYLSRHCLSVFTICIIISLGAYLPVVGPIAWYLFPFVAGIVVARIPLMYIRRIKPMEAIFCFLSLSVIRNFSGNIVFIIDTLLCFAIAVIVYHWNYQGFIKNVFIELGKHSMNMFIFHSFIYYYWFREETYFSHIPIIIFLQLIVLCFILSVLIEFVKKRIGFYWLFNTIINKTIDSRKCV